MVEVFKTNVANAAHAAGLVVLLQQCFPGSRINFDLNDCDKVLRIEGMNLAPGNIIRLVEDRGYECCVLD